MGLFWPVSILKSAIHFLACSQSGREVSHPTEICTCLPCSITCRWSSLIFAILQVIIRNVDRRLELLNALYDGSAQAHIDLPFNVAVEEPYYISNDILKKAGRNTHSTPGLSVVNLNTT
jgi:hypothetical protein